MKSRPPKGREPGFTMFGGEILLIGASKERITNDIFVFF